MGIDAYVCRMDRNRSRCADEERKEGKILKWFGGGERYFNGSVALWVLDFFLPSEVPLQKPLVSTRTDHNQGRLNSCMSLDCQHLLGRYQILHTKAP